MRTTSLSPDPLGALAEIKRVHKPWRADRHLRERAGPLDTWAWDQALRIFEKGHVRYYPSAELGRMIEQAGFEQRRLCALRNEFLSHGKLFASIQLWSARRPRSMVGGGSA